MKKFLGVLGLAVLGTVGLQAGLTASFVNAAPQGGGVWQFNYQLTLADDDELNPAAIGGANGAMCTTGGGAVPCAPSTTFATIYDVPNLIVDSTIPSPSVGANVGWGVLTQFVGITPVTSQGGNVNPPNGDNASIENVTFYYTGGTVYCGGTDQGCKGTFQSSFSGFSFEVTGSTGATALGSYTSSVTNSDFFNNQGQTGINAVNYGSGSVLIPLIASSTSPEPASIALLGLGLAGLGFAGRRLRRS